MKNPDLVLVDGSSYLYRAFHAMPPLTTSDGQPVGALRGILNMLKKTFEVTQPTLGAVVFDAPGKTFRDAMYPEYKANRPSMPDELRAQIEPIHELVRAMGLPLIMVPDVEADDVIGTLCKAYAKQCKSVLVSTGDKDMAQLVNDQVTLVNTMGDQWTYLDPAGVVEKFGVPPERIIDYLALMGDKVDNVPGVESCGPKTAVKWLTAYGDLDGVVAHADEVKGKAGEKLRAALDFLPLGKDLVTIKLDCELEPMDLTLPGPDEAKLAELYTRFEFKGLLASLGSQAPEVEPVQPASIDTQYQLIDDPDAMRAAIEACVRAGQFALDTETTSVSPTQAELVGVSLSWAPGEACYIPVSHEVLEPQLTLDELKAQLQPLLSNPDLIWIAQNLKYDWIVLTQAGFDIACQLQDTMLISYVLNATGSRHDMDTLALKHLNHQTIKLDCELEPMDLTLPGPDEAKLAELYNRFEFKGLLASLGSQAPEVEPVQPEAIATQYQLIDDPDALQAAIEACVQAGQFALDTETTSVSPTQAELVGVSLSWAPGEACYIPASHEVLEPQLTLYSVHPWVFFSIPATATFQTGSAATAGWKPE